jgi:hypothetical protein
MRFTCGGDNAWISARENVSVDRNSRIKNSVASNAPPNVRKGFARAVKTRTSRGSFRDHNLVKS